MRRPTRETRRPTRRPRRPAHGMQLPHPVRDMQLKTGAARRGTLPRFLRRAQTTSRGNPHHRQRPAPPPTTPRHAPLRPLPHQQPRAPGPSCFFPARAATALLTPATAALLLTLPTATVLPQLSPTTAPSLATTATAATAPRVAHTETATARRERSATGAEDTKHGEQQAADRAGQTADRAWPVDGQGQSGIRPTVLRGWEPPPAPWAAGHRGVDLASSVGAPVRSAAPGRVAYAGNVAGRGVLTIELSRSGRPPLRTTYEPVRATVHKGQRVTAGQPVGVLQRGPFHCREPCLHWGLRRGKTYLDPLSLLPASMRNNGPSRLLPVFGIPLPAGGQARLQLPSPPKSAAEETRSKPSGAALTGTAALAAATLWAVGRLSPARSARRRRHAGRKGASRAWTAGPGEGVSAARAGTADPAA
ncbi:M23 family metallopeptidase [Streptomyces lydicus]|uniref:M23 family metallopeptidase n=1 Tax=Streptomyces lydicus TaxID=47763 RepID=UPI002E31BACE|nr:M23 family metallopeptidase [Streptomyces lydicus]